MSCGSKCILVVTCYNENIILLYSALCGDAGREEEEEEEEEDIEMTVWDTVTNYFNA